MASNISAGAKLAGSYESLGGMMHKTATVIVCAVLAMMLTACGTIGGASRGVGEVASGVGADFSSVGEWIGNF